jgi:hypothetical protein
MSAAEIHHELCVAYGQNVMSVGTVRHRCKMFKDGQTDVHDEKQSGQPFVVSGLLFKSSIKKCEKMVHCNLKKKNKQKSL